MRKDLHWLFHLCSEEQILTPQQIHDSLRRVRSHTTLEDVGEILNHAGLVEDRKHLSKLIKSATKHASHKDEAPPLPPSVTVDFQTLAPDFGSWFSLTDDELRDAIFEWIDSCIQQEVSDIHVSSHSRPRVRHHREIQYLSDEPLDHDLANRINQVLLSPGQKEIFEKEWDLDYALPLKELDSGAQLRLRVNLTRHEYGVSGVYHIPRSGLTSIEGLGFPNASKIRELLSYHNGMILICGPVGCGKTTTLSCLINELNQTRREHIITIEDPIEVIQQSVNSIVTQREVGSHTRSFNEALASSLREDPDIIVVGELRDLETIELAVTAAETGHLVIGTLHTRDSASTLNRITDVFPPSQQKQIRSMIADSMRGIICQRLIPSTSGGVVLASELMINNSATANIMREAKESGLQSAMQTGKRQGMRTMDESLIELYQTGRISEETARLYLKDQNLLT